MEERPPYGGNEVTRSTVMVHTERLDRIDARLATLEVELKEMRADLYRLLPRCDVHSEKITRLESTVGLGTAGGAIGILGLLAWRILDLIGGGKP